MALTAAGPAKVGFLKTVWSQVSGRMGKLSKLESTDPHRKKWQPESKNMPTGITHTSPKIATVK